MILVVGATGILGGAVTHTLLERGEDVRVLVRPSSSYGPLEAAGADVAFGDLKDPAGLHDALQGVRRVVTTANTAKRGGSDTVEAVDLRGNLALVDAAARAGVEQFVFVSASNADPDSPVPFLAAKGEVEQRLRASGMPFTIVKPVPFMEDWIGFVIGAQLARGNRVVLVGEGDRKRTFVALADVAALMAALVGNPAAANREIAIGGDSASYRDVVRLYAEASGQGVEIQHVQPFDDVPHLPDQVAQLWSAMELAPEVDERTPDVARGFGLELTPIASFVRRQRA